MAVPLAVTLLLAALTAAPTPAPEQLEFSGYLNARGTTQFVIADLGAKTNSGWISLGDSFGGYTLVGFDAKTEALTVENAGTSIRLTLKSAVVVAGPAKGGSADATLAGQIRDADQRAVSLQGETKALRSKVQEFYLRASSGVDRSASEAAPLEFAKAFAALLEQQLALKAEAQALEVKMKEFDARVASGAAQGPPAAARPELSHAFVELYARLATTQASLHTISLINQRLAPPRDEETRVERDERARVAELLKKLFPEKP